MIPVVTTGDTAADYARWARRHGLADTSVACQTRVIRLAEREIGCRLADADPDDVADWIASKKAPETRRAYSCAIRAVVRAGLAPAAIADELPRARIPRHQPHPVPEDVLDRMLDAPDPYDRVCVLLAAFAGLRRGEIPKVQPCDVQRIGDGWRVRVDGKGDVERWAPVPGWVAEEVIPWLPVPRSRHTIGYRITHLIAACGGTGGIHGLRHYYGTTLMRQCHDLRLVQEAMGHASPVTTAIYTAVADDDSTRAVEGMRRPRPRLRVVS